MPKKITSGLIIRFSLAFVLFFFGIEIISESTFTPIYGLSTYSLLNLNIWAFPLISNNEVFKYLVGISSFIAGILLIANQFKRAIGITLASLFIVGIITDPHLFFQPHISIFKTSLNIALTGSALSMIADHQGKNVEQIIIRTTLGTSVMLIFISSFLWINENNLIWSFYLDQLSQQIPLLSLPVTASILGTAAALLIIGVLPRTIGTILGIFFLVLLVIHGLAGYIFIGIIGSCFSLIPQNKTKEKTSDPQKKDKSHKRKNKKI